MADDLKRFGRAWHLSGGIEETIKTLANIANAPGNILIKHRPGTSLLFFAKGRSLVYLVLGSMPYKKKTPWPLVRK
jgi:hypothetical protein